jgi:predicted nucleic acid-binding protein
MIVLDTDHVRVLRLGDARAAALEQRILSAGDPDIFTTIVSVHEGIKGWQDEANRATTAAQIIQHYERLYRLITFFGSWPLLPFDQAAGSEYERLRRLRLRSINTLDLRIASIVLSRSALLLSGDGHFGLVPDLRVEDWRSQ